MPEKEAFCVFVRLMETYEMRTMFTLNMEGLHLRLHQFATLLTQLCPELDAHLARHSIHPAMYASQWFLTLFAYTFPMSLVLRVYDLVFAEGAVETITRVAIAVMQKNQDTLLAIDDFEQLMLYLSSRKLYEAYKDNEEQVIVDTMALSSVITQTKMDSIAESHARELEQEKERAQQLLAVRMHRRTSSTCTSRSGSVVGLHQQIEDLLTALSQLQKEHSRLSEELVGFQMREMDHENERQRLAKRNQTLEKRLAKIKMQQPRAMMSPLTPSEGDFRSFVDTLRTSGDFGALVAGALSPTTEAPPQPFPNDDDENDDDEEEKVKKEPTSIEKVTSELMAYKLANFEMGQKYQRVCTQHDELQQQMHRREAEHQEEIDALQAEADALQAEKEQLVEERDEMDKEHRETEQKLLAAKKTASELQLEKLAVQKQVEQLEKRVETLEQEKRDYLMPRDSFSEEVFAAHQTLFGSAGKTAPQTENDEDVYKAQLAESELRCRELEKLLAESKCKLAEYETILAPPSRRQSLRRASSMRSNAISTPTSPSYPWNEPRESTDSFTSTTSSKRSSVYSRIWSSISPSHTAATSPAASVANKSPTLTAQSRPLAATHDIVVEEPQQI